MSEVAYSVTPIFEDFELEFVGSFLCYYSTERPITENLTNLVFRIFVHKKMNEERTKKFEDVGLKHQFYQRLNCILDATPEWLLLVNNGTDAKRLTDLFTFMSNAMLKSGKQILGMDKPSKFNVPGWNERAKESNARYMQ